MLCPRCHIDKDRVLETRILANGAIIRRRRVCEQCSHRFTSYERIDEYPLYVIKKDNDREEFSRKKLTDGIMLAVRKRPISIHQVKNILDMVEEAALIQAGNSREISSKYIGELVIAHLYKIDKVAYLRFASVYRNFESIEEFIKEINELQDLSHTHNNSQ